MRNTGTTDPELLAEWNNHRREPAFHELVARYAGLVHATALRTCGDDTMAAEASQLTFILLARKARSLTSCVSLGGWLHRTALMQAKNLVRQSRREMHKRRLLALEEPNHSHDDAWREIQPVLDESLAALSAKDRDVLLLRFYRALSVREVADTLGIATGAAQKRIDRATGRLRSKLMRRGCRAGGTLAATILGGFSADAHAAGSAVTLLAKNAISAAGPASAAGTLASRLSMLSNPAVLSAALIVLSAGAAWVAWQSTAVRNERDAGTENRLAERQATRMDNRRKRISADNDAPMIDWRSVGLRMLEARKSENHAESTRLWNEIMPQLSSMSSAKLSASLDEIARLDLSPDCRDLLEDLLLDPLRRKNPQLTLSRHFRTVSKPKCFPGSPFPMALMELARTDPYGAGAWLDEQIAAGTLEHAQANDHLTSRLELEASLFSGFVSVDTSAALERLLALPENQRAIVLARNPSAVRGADVRIYADFVRNQIAEKDRTEAIIAPVKDMAWNEGYSPVSDYIGKIETTTAERTACVEKAASERFLRIAMERDVTGGDFEELRTWIGAQAPAETNRITGEMLGKVVRFGGLAAGKLSFDDAAALALKYHENSGDDQVLVGFLKCCERLVNERTRSLAMRISNEQKRGEVLQRLGFGEECKEQDDSGRISPDHGMIR